MPNRFTGRKSTNSYTVAIALIMKLMLVGCKSITAIKMNWFLQLRFVSLIGYKNRCKDNKPVQP